MTTMGEAWEKFYRPGMSSEEAQAFQAGWNAVIDACGGHDHLLQIHENEWTLQHPITERLEGTLFSCSLHNLIGVMVRRERFPGPGRYRFWVAKSPVSDTKEWNWEEVE